MYERGRRKKGYPKEIISSLIDGKLACETLKDIMSSPKEEDRLKKVTEIQQEGGPWGKRILLPVPQHLYIVRKGPERFTKCRCRYEYRDYKRKRRSAPWFTRGILGRRSLRPEKGLRSRMDAAQGVLLSRL